MKKSRNNAWKRVAAGALSMALVAGIMPANVGGFLTGGKGIVAHAEDYTKQDLNALIDNVNGWLEDYIEDSYYIHDLLSQTDHKTSNALNIALSNAESVLNNQESTQDIINHTYDQVISAYSDAQRAVNATPITGGNFLLLTDNGAITLDKDYRITNEGNISLAELDLNGHALYMGDGQLIVSPEKTLTVEDSSETGTGLLVGNSYVLYNDGTLTIDGGTIKGNITNFAKLNISGGEIRLNQEALDNNGGTVTVTGGKFNFNPSDYVADGYKAIMDAESNIYEVSEIMPFSAETDDSIYDGCEINLFAEDGQSFETTITVKKDEAFTKADALSYLGIDGEVLNVVDEYDEQTVFAKISTVVGENATDEDNDGTFELDITFTVSPVNTSTNETPNYSIGSGSVEIGGMTIYVNVAEREQEKTSAQIGSEGLSYIKYTTLANKIKEYNDLDGITGFYIKAGTDVKLIIAHKTVFSYFDGFDQNIDAKETRNTDGTYTYEFTMPGYDVYSEYVMNGLNFEAFNSEDYNNLFDGVDGEDNAEKAANVWKKAIDDEQATQFDDIDGKLYYADTAIKVNSPIRLMFSYINEKGKEVNIDANEKIVTPENEAMPTVYSYSFEMPAFKLNINPYEHVHSYKYKVEGSKLIRTCLNKDDACEEQNADGVIFELKTNEESNSFVYDSETKSAIVKISEDVSAEDVKYEAGIVSYYKTDVFGDAIGDALNAVPIDAGNYLAECQVWYDVNDNDEHEDNELFDLSLNYQITPFELTADNIYTVYDMVEDKYNPAAPLTAAATTGELSGPVIKVKAFENGELVNGLNGDYVITGIHKAIEPGEYEITVNGVGNYKGSVEIPWTLTGENKKISKEMFTVNTVYKNGFAEAMIEFKEGNNSVNIKDHPNMFTVSCPTVVNEGGTYKLTIDGIGGGYYGSVDLDWVVDEYQITNKYASVKKVTYSADKKLEFRSKMIVPEGAVMTKIGLFATNNPEEKYKLNFTDTPVQNDDVFVKEYTTDLAGKTTSSFTWRKSQVANGTTWYAVPYVCYTLNGKDVTVYGDLIEATVQNNKASYKVVELGQAKFKSSSYEAKEKRLSFLNRMIVPDGCTMTAIGICATNNQAKSADLSINTAAVANETYIKVYTTDLEGKTASNFTWRKSSVNPGDTWYVKPYVTYADESGATYTAYGALETVTATVAETAPVLE